MTTRSPGESITPKVTITKADGNAYDPSTLTLKIYNPGGTVEDTITKAAMTNPSAGAYYYTYTLPSDAADGDWKYQFESGSTNAIIHYEYFTVFAQVHTTLANIEDVYREINITSSDIGTETIVRYITEAEDLLKLRTHRSTFTGSTANTARVAVVGMVIGRLAVAHPDKMQSAIDSITENGTTIKFNNGKTLDSYRADVSYLIDQMKITSPTSRYAYTNTSTFYAEDD